MPRERLTPDRIRRFSCPSDSEQVFLWDTDSPRLAVRATSGAKSFIFESKLNRRTIRATIGDVRSWTLEDARAESRRLQTEVDQGIDPRVRKAERLAKADAEHVFARVAKAPAMEAWNAYVDSRRTEWSERHLQNHQKFATAGGEPRSRGHRKGESRVTVSGPLHALLVLPLAEINAEAVRAWLDENNKTRPTWTAQAFRSLRAFINWCVEHPEYSQVVQADACTQLSVRRKVAVVKAKEGDCLEREQLRPWFEQVRKQSNPVHVAYLQCLLLTGARRGELAALKWDDVDFKWNSMTIRDKVEGERTIPLTPYVAHLLLDIRRRNETPPPEWRILNGAKIHNDLATWSPSPFVFYSTRSASGQIQEPRIAHNKALAAAGLPPLTLHGLRRSFGTLAEWVEAPTGVVAQIMGHKPSALAEKHYRRRPLDLLRQWHTRIEDFILTEAGIELPRADNVGLKAIARD